MTKIIPTKADEQIQKCLEGKRSFAMIAGAGSGKTTSLIMALEFLREEYADTLRKNDQRIACITYTKRAVGVISSRLRYDDLYVVSTLHSFLWGEIKRFTFDIHEALREYRIPQQLEKAREDDNGKDTKKARQARARVARLEAGLASLDDVSSFRYEDASYSDYENGRLSHDDVIEIAGYLLEKKPVFRKALGFRYPFIFIDEAQDTFENIVSGLNLVCNQEGLPIIGYFGDPWQQIFDKRAGDFAPPENGETITKQENYRCSQSVITLLNAFRDDVKQYAAGRNKDVLGSVSMMLIQAEDPEAPRKRYSEEQLDRALQRLDVALEDWAWADRDDIIKLFLVRQMIARRLGFSDLNQLFTGQFASSRAEDDYETGEHFLLKPFITTIWPLVQAKGNDDSRSIIDLLRRDSPAFDIDGMNRERPLNEMVNLSNELLVGLLDVWENRTVRDVLIYCEEHSLLRLPERLSEHLHRPSRKEEYDEEQFGDEKSDWLCDQFFEMGTQGLKTYCDFISENTAYSTQHGVKGEQYSDVLVVYDDVEAAWSNYNFTKSLTPQTAGAPTEGQFERGRKLAYVCFSRAERNLRILLFTPNPEAARAELLEQGLLTEDQVVIQASA